jgi:hypothetical protein
MLKPTDCNRIPISLVQDFMNTFPTKCNLEIHTIKNFEENFLSNAPVAYVAFRAAPDDS